MIWTVCYLTLRGCIWSVGEKRQSLRALKMWMRSPKPASAEHCRARRKYSRQQRQSRALTSPFEELHEDCSRRFKEKEERDGLPEKPGVHEILEYLKKEGIPAALASFHAKSGSDGASGQSGNYILFSENYLRRHGGAWQACTGYLSEGMRGAWGCTRTGTGGGGFPSTVSDPPMRQAYIR